MLFCRLNLFAGDRIGPRLKQAEHHRNCANAQRDIWICCRVAVKDRCDLTEQDRDTAEQCGDFRLPRSTEHTDTRATS